MDCEITKLAFFFTSIWIWTGNEIDECDFLSECDCIILHKVMVDW